MNSRYYLVQESGPTKMTLEAGNNKKYKIQIGGEITCSCGGGRKEHCVHTIYAMLKIFRIDEGDPLLWQLAFTDTEIDNILERREKQLLKNRASNNQWQQEATSIEQVYR
jgi:E3 ubiquitin-protein ligase ZSWIM2